MFDKLKSDYRAHGSRLGAQGFWAMAVYRFGRWRHGIRSRVLRAPFSVAYHVLFKLVQVTAGIELPCEVVVGLSQVEEPCGRVFGDNVDIGAGANVLGAITVGSNVKTGVNAVVVRDVPPDSIVTGVPGRVRPVRAIRSVNPTRPSESPQEPDAAAHR